MVDFKRSQVSLFLMAALQFAGANGLRSLFIKRVGHDVTLPCVNVINDQNKCNRTTWNFSGSTSGTVELIGLGLVKKKIHENIGEKSDRLIVMENCSLVIKKVTDEDAGLYICQQFNKPGRGLVSDSLVLLSVVSLTEQKNNDEVTLNCFVSTYGQCEHTVKWLYGSQDVDKENTEVRTSESRCSASLHLKTSHHIYTSRFNFLKCKVTDGDKVQLFSFITGPSGGEKTKKTPTRKTTTTATTTPTSPTTINTAATPPTTTSTATTTEMIKTASPTTASTATTTATIKTAPPTTALTTTISSFSSATATNTSLPNNNLPTKLEDLWWLFIIVALVLVALLIIVVKVVRRQRTKGKKTQMNDDIGLTSNPAETQSAAETSQDTADPEDGVSYASISYTKKSHSKGRVLGKDEDDDEAVTYATVKASSSSAGASADLSSLYASIIKPKT